MKIPFNFFIFFLFQLGCLKSILTTTTLMEWSLLNPKSGMENMSEMCLISGK